MDASNQHSERDEDVAYANTDRELWRDTVRNEHKLAGDYYADSIHVTETGRIGINVGGMVYIKTLREWHALAKHEEALRAGLIIRERLDQAEAFIEHLDANYRYAEWLGEDDEEGLNQHLSQTEAAASQGMETARADSSAPPSGVSIPELREWIADWRNGMFSSTSRDAHGWPIEMHGLVADLEGLVEQLEAKPKVGSLVADALTYRDCGRFDVTPCRERPEMTPDAWCPWCLLADAVSSPHSESHSDFTDSAGDPRPRLYP